MVTAMELGFPFLRDGMLIDTDGVPPLHADESGGASHCEGRGAACSVGLPKGQPNETCGVEMLWNVLWNAKLLSRLMCGTRLMGC